MITAQEALRLAAQKLPIKTKFVIRRDLQKLNDENTSINRYAIK